MLAHLMVIACILIMCIGLVDKKHILILPLIFCFLGCSHNKVFRFYSPDKFENIMEHTRSKSVKDIKRYYALQRAIENKFYPEYMELYHKPIRMYTFILPKEVCESSDLSDTAIQPYLETIYKETLEVGYKEIDKKKSDSLVRKYYLQTGTRDGYLVIYEYDKKECIITFSQHKGW